MQLSAKPLGGETRLLGRVSIIAVLLLSASIAGCSWIVDFAVSNRSDYAIEVLVQFSSQRGTCPYPGGKMPALSSTESMGWWRPDPDWRALATHEYTLDTTSCSFRLTLQPDTSVLVMRGGTTSDSRDLSYGVTLTIESESGTILLSGDELSGVFKRRSKTLYEYSYRKPKLASNDARRPTRPLKRTG